MSLPTKKPLINDTAVDKAKKPVKIFKTCGFIVFSALLVTLLINSILSVFVKSYYPTFGGYRLFAVVTDSMDPLIPAGNMIVSKVPLSEADIKVGDVITYEVREENSVILITHRVQAVRISDDGVTSYTTKGDNAKGVDPVRPVFSDIVGVFCGKQCAFFGYFFGFLQSTAGAIALIIIAFIIITTYIITQYVDFITVWRGSALRALKKSGSILAQTNDDALGAIADVIGIVSKEPANETDRKRKDKKLGWFIRTGALPKRPYSDDLDENAQTETLKLSVKTPFAASETAAVKNNADRAVASDAERMPFTAVERCETVRYEYTYYARLAQLKPQAKEWYCIVKNCLLGYERMRSRLCKRCESFTVGRKTAARLTVRGKSLYLALAADPNKYDGTKYAVFRARSASSKTPCMYKISSDRRAKYACELIDDAMQTVAARKADYVPTDHYVPYEGVWTLMNKGFVKRKIDVTEISYRIEAIPK